MRHLEPEFACVHAQKSHQIRRRGIGRIELNHRGGDEQAAHSARSVAHTPRLTNHPSRGQRSAFSTGPGRPSARKSGVPGAPSTRGSAINWIDTRVGRITPAQSATRACARPWLATWPRRSRHHCPRYWDIAHVRFAWSGPRATCSGVMEGRMRAQRATNSLSGLQSHTATVFSTESSYIAPSSVLREELCILDDPFFHEQLRGGRCMSRLAYCFQCSFWCLPRRTPSRRRFAT